MLPSIPDKSFFTMGEASRLTQVRAHTIRYWEERLGAPKPSRLPSGHRRYAREDLETILAIKDLVERRRLTLDGARRAMIERKRGRPAGGEAAADAGLSGKALKTLIEVRKELKSLVEDLGG